MRTILAFTVLAAFGCNTRATTSTGRPLITSGPGMLAVACEATPVDSTLTSSAVTTGPIDPAPSPSPVPAPTPTPSPSPSPDPTFCGCTDPLTGAPKTPCTKMTIVCSDVGNGTVTTLASPTTVAYAGDMPVIANYACGGGGGTGGGGGGGGSGGPCSTGAAFNARTVSHVAEFVTSTTLNVYAVPAGSTYVKSPTGGFLFPMLHAGEGFANPSREVRLSSTEVYYLDQQNDCVQVGNACYCSTC